MQSQDPMWRQLKKIEQMLSLTMEPVEKKGEDDEEETERSPSPVLIIKKTAPSMHASKSDANQEDENKSGASHGHLDDSQDCTTVCSGDEEVSLCLSTKPLSEGRCLHTRICSHQIAFP